VGATSDTSPNNDDDAVLSSSSAPVLAGPETSTSLVPPVSFFLSFLIAFSFISLDTN
jgi:hypothetical protein